LPPSASTPLPDEVIAPAAEVEPVVATPVGPPSKPSTSRMAFPVKGNIIRAYSKGKTEGIDIAAEPGSPVKASADGTVAAITADADQVPIIVVRHPGNLLTVYANVDKIRVKKGDKVKRGQELAVLRTGKDAYVHFEVRDGFDSIDPMPYLE
jgi:murein DD-endopeptidase MepM/ murein hydrolase activator NlpD